MREFTKEHNDLQWLFPVAETKKEAEAIFNECEEQAEYRFQCADIDEKDHDLAIDCYMKGASDIMQLYKDAIREKTVDHIYENLFNVKLNIENIDDNEEYNKFLNFKMLLDVLARPNQFKNSKHEQGLAKLLKEILENSVFNSDVIKKHSKKILELFKYDGEDKNESN